jgi:hypothetical protein
MWTHRPGPICQLKTISRSGWAFGGRSKVCGSLQNSGQQFWADRAVKRSCGILAFWNDWIGSQLVLCQSSTTSFQKLIRPPDWCVLCPTCSTPFFSFSLISSRFVRNTVQNIYTYISIHSYKYMYIYSISMIIFKKLSRLDLEIHKIDH